MSVYALIGSKSMQKAIPTINRMEPEAVYVKLTQNLPYKESRSYVKKYEIVFRSMRDGNECVRVGGRNRKND